MIKIIKGRKKKSDSILFKILCVQVIYNSMPYWSSRVSINIGTSIECQNFSIGK